MGLIGIIVVSMAVVFNGTLQRMFRMNDEMGVVNDQVIASQRISQVIRSGTRITAAEDKKLTIYAYFSPQDATLSQVTYYYDTSTKKLKVDKIPASGSPPNYTYLDSNKKTLVLVDNYEQVGGMFVYKDANGATGPFAADQLKDIKSITVTIHSKARGNVSESQITNTILLRNRKVNL